MKPILLQQVPFWVVPSHLKLLQVRGPFHILDWVFTKPREVFFSYYKSYPFPSLSLHFRVLKWVFLGVSCVKWFVLQLDGLEAELGALETKASDWNELFEHANIFWVFQHFLWLFFFFGFHGYSPLDILMLFNLAFGNVCLLISLSFELSVSFRFL